MFSGIVSASCFPLPRFRQHKNLYNHTTAKTNRPWALGQAALSAEAQKALDRQLYGAAQTGDVAAIERLVAEGASPNAKDEDEFSAVCRAAFQRHAGAVSALVRLGADLDARDSLGDTALMGAAKYGRVEYARALLDAGAARTLRATGGGFEGKTALEIAEERSKAKPDWHWAKQSRHESDEWFAARQKGCAEVAALTKRRLGQFSSTSYSLGKARSPNFLLADFASKCAQGRGSRIGKEF